MNVRRRLLPPNAAVFIFLSWPTWAAVITNIENIRVSDPESGPLGLTPWNARMASKTPPIHWAEMACF